MKTTFAAALALVAVAAAPAFAAPSVKGVSPEVAATLSTAQVAQIKAVNESDENTLKKAQQIRAIVAASGFEAASRANFNDTDLTVAQRAQIKAVNESDENTLKKAQQIAAILANG